MSDDPELDQAAIARLGALDAFRLSVAHRPGQHFVTWRERAQTQLGPDARIGE
jgi:hypothetical protein